MKKKINLPRQPSKSSKSQPVDKSKKKLPPKTVVSETFPSKLEPPAKLEPSANSGSPANLQVLPGLWETVALSNGTRYFVCFDASLADLHPENRQFQTIPHRKSGKSIHINVKEEGVKVVSEVWPVSIRSVMLHFPGRKVCLEWLNPTRKEI